MNEKEHAIVLIILIFIALFLTLIALSYESKKSNYYSYSRILCGKGYCMDVYVECKGNKVLNVSIETIPEFVNKTYFSELGWCER